jgi:hypothetical protein
MSGPIWSLHGHIIIIKEEQPFSAQDSSRTQRIGPKEDDFGIGLSDRSLSRFSSAREV